MSFLGLLFLIFLFVFVIRPLVTLYLRFNRAKSQFRDAFRANGRNPQPQSSGRKAGWSAPPQRKKKIDPAVGEYVEFQEISTETTLSTPTSDETYTETEQQIVDVKWEEVGNK